MIKVLNDGSKFLWREMSKFLGVNETPRKKVKDQ
jgi:hypothetical protein